MAENIGVELIRERESIKMNSCLTDCWYFLAGLAEVLRAQKQPTEVRGVLSIV